MLRELRFRGPDFRESRSGYGGFCQYDPVRPAREPEARLLLTRLPLGDEGLAALATSPLLGRFERRQTVRGLGNFTDDGRSVARAGSGGGSDTGSDAAGRGIFSVRCR